MKKKKKLFKNYTYEFDQNERKLISNFSKQIASQMEAQADDRFAKDIKVFGSIREKVNGDSESVKLTKEEATRLKLHLKENAKNLEEKMSKSWFIKKWFYKMMYNQYNSLLITHFSD